MVRTSIRMCCTQNLNVYSKNRKNLYSPRFLRLYYVCIISKTKYISELQTAQCQQQMDGDRHVQTGENIPPTQSIRKTHIHPSHLSEPIHPSTHPCIIQFHPESIIQWPVPSTQFGSMPRWCLLVNAHETGQRLIRGGAGGLGAGECVDSS